ncbi:MAG: sodium-coupled permease [Planctomycetaceae bacterium]|nr:sodium-coupled permease [Planctomycetaceae bacterium]
MGGLTRIDWLIVAVYASSTVALGYYFSRRQRDTQEYFTGSGNMNPFLVGVSLFATLLSTISYLSMPGEVLGKGPMHMTSLLALPIVFAIVGYGLLPLYMRYRVTSAYELLEKNLGIGVRMLGVTMFLALRLVWMSLLVYKTAEALIVMIGVDEKWIPAVVLATGLVAVTYASLGGLRAVVVTDLIQTILLFGGAVLVVVMVTVDFGGFGWFPTKWDTNWDPQPIFSFDPSVRATMIGAILSALTWQVCTAGGDQVSIQRFMSTRDAGAARKSFATQMCVSLVVSATLFLVGLSLLAYFKAHPEMLGGLNMKTDADKLFPRFIATRLPPGVSGLVVSAMFAAAMSSIDSGVNSITAVVSTDLLGRFGRSPKSEKDHLVMARFLAFGIGASVVVGSAFIGLIEGNITEVTNKTVNLMVPMIFCLFFFALFVPFANPRGVWIGWACGFTTAVLIGFSGELFGWIDLDLKTQRAPVSFQWMGPSALAVNMVVGTLACWLLRDRTIKAPRSHEPS